MKKGLLLIIALAIITGFAYGQDEVSDRLKIKIDEFDGDKSVTSKFIELDPNIKTMFFINKGNIYLYLTWQVKKSIPIDTSDKVMIKLANNTIISTSYDTYYYGTINKDKMLSAYFLIEKEEFATGVSMIRFEYEDGDFEHNEGKIDYYIEKGKSKELISDYLIIKDYLKNNKHGTETTQELIDRVKKEYGV